jgi:hypothetical protein
MGRYGVRLVAMAVGALASLTGCGLPTSNGAPNASCHGPYLNDQPHTGVFRGPPRTVSPGESFRVYGHWYTSTCNDTGGQEPHQPLPPVHLTLVLPGGAVQELGEFRPDGTDLGFSELVHVPAGTPAGTATVRDDREDPATYRFRIDPS